MNNKGIIGSLLNKSSIDELAHQARGDLARLLLGLQRLDLLLELIDQVLLGLIVDLLSRSCFFFGSDLCLGSATLALGLQHVGSYALRICAKTKVS